MLLPRENEVREVKDLCGVWKFKADWENCGREENWQRKLPEDTISMPVPSSYNDITQDSRLRDFIGDVWYETEFYVPAGWKEKRVVLRFGSATHKAQVWVNGSCCMQHKGGYLPFEADVSAYVNIGGNNRLTVAVNNVLDWTTLPPGEVKTAFDDRYPEGYRVQEYFHDFFNYAGIHRPVRLYCTPKDYIRDVTINTSWEGTQGIVSYEVESDGQVQVRILDMDGQEVARQTGATGKVSIENVQLWQPGKGYLYTLEVHSGEDLYRQPFGVRTVEVKGNHFLINGKPFYFKGFGKHEDMDIKGKGLDLPIIVKDFNLLRWLGANSVRTSHYPYAEEWMDLADREGIVVIDETTAVGFNFFKEGEQVFCPNRASGEVLEHHLQVLRELYVRDKNHPCVVAWSVANEAKTQEENALPYFEAVAAEMRRLEKYRPVTIVMNVNPAEDRVGQLFDFICVNGYNSWYNDPGHLEVIDRQLEHRLRMWYEKYHKPLIMTEFGADTIAGFHQDPPVMFTEEYQCEMIRRFQAVFDRLEFVIGEHIWAFADFATKQGITRVGGNKKGVFTRQRQPKMAAYMLKERWHENK